MREATRQRHHRHNVTTSFHVVPQALPQLRQRYHKAPQAPQQQHRMVPHGAASGLPQTVCRKHRRNGATGCRKVPSLLSHRHRKAQHGRATRRDTGISEK
jgi:hypothetical protein